jgi:diadenosine tetraphosphate (Ap4A) HIT family hydrolase
MASTDCPFCLKLSRLDELPADELVWEFPNSVVLLGPWQHYQGYCVVVSRTHASELFHLPAVERENYLDEMVQVARAISDAFRPAKINYELLGNQVPHLHWHLFPRYPDDPERLKPVWLALDRAEHDPQARQRLVSGPLDRQAVGAGLREMLTRRK